MELGFLSWNFPRLLPDSGPGAGRSKVIEGRAEVLERGGQNLPPAWASLALHFAQGAAPLKGQRKCAGEALWSPLLPLPAGLAAEL